MCPAACAAGAVMNPAVPAVASNAATAPIVAMAGASREPVSVGDSLRRPDVREAAGSARPGAVLGRPFALNGIDGVAALGLDGAGTKVAVLDTGVDRAHPDLGSRLLDESCFCSGRAGGAGCCPNGQPAQFGTGSAQDDNGHGTNVAGIIVGQGGVAPRGGAPGAQLIAIKVADRDNRFCCSTDLIAALDWLLATHPDVDVVNLSLGTDALFAGVCDAETDFTRSLSTAVNALVRRGALVTVSAGNNGRSGAMSAPACLQNALSVGATWSEAGGSLSHLGCSESATAPRQTACFSNRSEKTDVYAAGAFVVSAGLGGGTSTFGGTSQATPMVAACALALRQAAPEASVDARRAAIKHSTRKVTDAVSGRSYPFLDCADAVRVLNPALVAAGGLRGERVLASAIGATPQ